MESTKWYGYKIVIYQNPPKLARSVLLRRSPSFLKLPPLIARAHFQIFKLRSLKPPCHLINKLFRVHYFFSRRLRQSREVAGHNPLLDRLYRCSL